MGGGSFKLRLCGGRASGGEAWQSLLLAFKFQSGEGAVRIPSRSLWKVVEADGDGDVAQEADVDAQVDEWLLGWACKEKEGREGYTWTVSGAEIPGAPIGSSGTWRIKLCGAFSKRWDCSGSVG